MTSNTQDLKTFLESLTSFRELKPKQYPQQCAKLQALTQFLPTDCGLSQRAWHVLNDCYSVPTCRVCDNPVTWFIRKKRYREVCSNRCVGADSIIKQRRQNVCLANNGVTVPAKSETVRTKMKNTNIKRHGVSHALQNVNLKAKADATMAANRGIDVDSVVTRNTPHLMRFSDKTIENINNKQWLIKHHHELRLPLSSISKILENYDPSAISRKMAEFGIEIKHYFQSTGEQAVVEFIQSLGVEVQTSDRSLIHPYELDIYLPDYNIAIEYCGLYWHSEQRGKDRHYHKRKYTKCSKLGIQLLTMFEDEWNTRREQVKRKITHMLHKSTEARVYPRTCTIVSLTQLQKKQFFDTNHIQGNGPGSITYGLIAGDGEIVAAMSFIQQKHQHYLNRYATSCIVPGGFSKILNHFKKSNQWNTVISFADLRWSDGVLYRHTGWTLDSTLAPDYYYSPDGIQRIHKFNYRRKALPKLLDVFDSNLSEWENCKANGVLRIWDCGKQRWVINNS